MLFVDGLRSCRPTIEPNLPVVRVKSPSVLVKESEWEASHLWRFEIVDGERRHTRRVRVTNSKGEELRVRMVYDFVEE